MSASPPLPGPPPLADSTHPAAPPHRSIPTSFPIPHSPFRILHLPGPGGTPRGKRPERQERLRSGDVWTPTREIRPDTGKAAGSLCTT
jgi:hypothetical protein